jgi:transcriptional regulator with XRE-family HTH domain
MKNHIYFIRKKKNIKQYDMAVAIGVSPSYLSKMERCKNNVTKKLQILCAEYLDIPIEKLFTNKKLLNAFPDFFDDMKNKLWAIRELKGIKQREFAKKVKITIPYLSRIEAGLQEPTEEFKKKCAKELKIPVEKIFGNEMIDSNDERIDFKSILKDIVGE